MRTSSMVAVMLAASGLSCGGHSTPTWPAISGAYEFVITSDVTGGVTLVEANLASNGNQSNASGVAQVQILTLEKKIWYVNGSCPGSMPGQNSVSASLNGSDIALTFNEGGNALPGQGALSGATINANYSVTDSSCPDLTGTLQYPPGTDEGGIVGNQVPNLAGTYSGALSLPNGTDNAVLTLTEASDHTLIVNAALTGPIDNGTFTLTGNAIGNVMFASGSISGRMVTLFGYYDRAGTYTKLPNSLFVFDYDTGASGGLLPAQ